MLALIVITVISLALTAAMGVVTWRIVREERRRSAARVHTLARDLEFDPAKAASLPIGDDFLVAVEDAVGGRRLATAILAGVLVVGGGVVLAVTVSSGTRAATRAATGGTAPALEAPLELLALQHERDGDRLSIRGTVRNPLGAPAFHQLAVIVFVFGRDGGFIASGRAPADVATLAPGEESSFLVEVLAADVARYRISFKIDDRIVPHVDRRDRTELVQQP